MYVVFVGGSFWVSWLKLVVHKLFKTSQTWTILVPGWLLVFLSCWPYNTRPFHETGIFPFWRDLSPPLFDLIYAFVECKASYLRCLFLTPKKDQFLMNRKLPFQNNRKRETRKDTRDRLSPYSNHRPPLKALRKHKLTFQFVCAEN